MTHNRTSKSCSLASRANRIFAASVTGLLKGHDFRKLGATYIRNQEGYHEIIEIQKRRSNDGKRLEFAINSGIFVPGVVSSYVMGKDPAIPKVHNCCLSVRVGGVEDWSVDKWWTIAEDDERPQNMDEIIASEVEANLENHLIKFFGRFGTLKDIALFLESPREESLRLIMPQALSLCCAYAGLIYAKIGLWDSTGRAMSAAMGAAAGAPNEVFIRRLYNRIIPIVES